MKGVGRKARRGKEIQRDKGTEGQSGTGKPETPEVACPVAMLGGTVVGWAAISPFIAPARCGIRLRMPSTCTHSIFGMDSASS